MRRSLLALNTHSGSLADIPHVELLFRQNQTSRRDRAEADAPILAPYWMIVPRYPMVAGSGYDACREDWRHTLAARPAAWAGNAKSSPRSLGVLADLTVRQFWSVRAAQLNIWGNPDAMRPSSGWCRWNDLELEKGFGGLVHIDSPPSWLPNE